MEEILKSCSLLVLCKEELFFQTDKGDTITTWYPVGKEAASVCSLYFKIPLSHDGGANVNNEEIIKDGLKERYS